MKVSGFRKFVRSDSAIRLAGVVCLAVALGALLHASGLGWKGIGIWALFVVGVVLFGESSGWARRIEESASPKDDSDKLPTGPASEPPSGAAGIPTTNANATGAPPPDVPKNVVAKEPDPEAWHRSGLTRSLMEVALMVVVALGWLNYTEATGRARQNQQFQQLMIDRLTKDLDGDLKRCLDSLGSALGGRQGGTGENVLKLDEEIKSALLDYLKNQSAQGNGVPWMTIVLIAAVLGLLFFVVKKHPSAAPIAGAAPLSIAMIEHAEHLSKFCGKEFWGLIAIFGVIAIVLMVVGFFVEGPADTDSGGGAKKIASPLTMGFSLMILVVSFAVVARCPSCSSCGGGAGVDHGPGPSPGNSHVSVLNSTDVTSLTKPLFGEGKSSPASKVDELKGEVLAGFKTGDKLLLLGSADCTRYSKGNDQLAQDRSNEIKSQLKQLIPSLKDDDFVVASNSLPEYVTCQKTDNMRAVFPFLIHTESKVSENAVPR